MWFLYSLFFAIWTSVSAVLVKRIVKTVDPGITIFIGTLLTIPFAFIFLLITSGIPKVSEGFYALLLPSSILDVVAFLASVWAVRISPISLIAPISAFNPLFTTLIAIVFLNETIVPFKFFGVLIIVVGSYLLNIKDMQHGLLSPFKKLFSNKGVQLALLANFIWGITPIFQKKAILLTSPTTPFFPSLIGMIFVAIFITPFIFRKVTEIPQAFASNFKLFLILALFSVPASFAAFTAFSQTNVGYATAIFKLSTIFTILLGALFFKEERIKERLVGASVMLAGTILIVL